ncbi:upstream activation factor subunit spp27 isoform X2 [Spodoptera litura]|uniref:Upstream activation factor subunit spp27 isoform X2 n=1 Tax=Spodoptera litura TaxID=69820 RepID=A0A9J7EFP4_SPOLT|nr:upstream activation factor subunit spp27 isoform X2 [Spodoptera litura]
MSDSETEISEEILQKEIADILDHASLENTSTKKVIQKLEKKLGVDLSSKKKMIDQIVMDIVNNMESEDEDMDESSDEEPKKKAPPKKVKKEEDDEDDEERDDSNDSDWGSGGKKKKAEEKKKKAAPKSKKDKTKKGGVKKARKGSGYTRACKLSPALAELMGESELPRHEVVKRVWAIIKEKQLFDPKNRQYAICDKALFKVIGEETFHTFSMMKYLKNHFLD